MGGDVVDLKELLATIEDGDGIGWEAEFGWLRKNHAPKVRGLALSILQNGIREPVLIGPDGRMWDGHHRVYVAYMLGFTHIPVKYARSS